MTKRAIIIGAGPAGLTAAWTLLKKSDIHPVILEESGEIGGISRTVVHEGNRMDIGGHRFFSKSDEVMDFWKNVMPMQGAPAWDDKILNIQKEIAAGGPDPEKEDRVMLQRRRVSRILYLRKFFDYPLSLKPETFWNMGFIRTFCAGCGYLWSMIFKRKEDTLKDFMINRFGAPLYHMFFEKYTEKVWGRNPDSIDASWGAQRIKGLSLWKAVLNVFKSVLGGNGKKVETSLIDRFIYPKKGPGQLWETVASDVQQMGGEIVMHAKAIRIKLTDGKISSVTARMPDGSEQEFSGDFYFSSMPIKDLVEAAGKDAVPANVYKTASELPYRDFITVGLQVDKLLLKNKTKIRTVNDQVPDCWIYIQEADVKIGRLQIFNNWSPYMLADPQNSVWIGLEYFCNEGDELWNMDDKSFIDFAEKELIKIGVIAENSVKSSVRVRVKKAYPAYFGSYSNFGAVRNWLDTIDNLFCIGRNGQHRYNNMDHSMLSAVRAAEQVIAGSNDKNVIWSVNSEEEYHEEKQS